MSIEEITKVLTNINLEKNSTEMLEGEILYLKAQISKRDKIIKDNSKEINKYKSRLRHSVSGRKLADISKLKNKTINQSNQLSAMKESIQKAKRHAVKMTQERNWLRDAIYRKYGAVELAEIINDIDSPFSERDYLNLKELDK